MSDARIILTEVLPNVVPVIVIAMSTTVGWMILETAGLSFLGLGLPAAAVADLGSMLGEARSALITNPHTSIVPGVMILIIVMAINLLGDGMRDALDPRLKSGALNRPLPATLVAPHAPARTPAEPRHPDPRQPSDAVPRQGPRLQGRRRRRPFASNPANALASSANRVGQSPSPRCRHGSCRLAARADHRRVRPLQGEDLIGAPYRKLRTLRGREVAYIFQDPLATLHPLYRVGDQLIEAISATVPSAATKAAASHRPAEAGPHPQRRKPHQRLPARDVGRHAPARRHRHGAGQRPRGDHR
jgi:peptide/nickel transport system permease protein